MKKIIAATFDIADGRCRLYNALEWYNFIADTREACPNAPAALEELFDYAYGDEFWFEANQWSQKSVYQVAFDLRSEEFVVCNSDAECEMVMAMAEEAGDEEEIFWAE